VPTAGTLEQPHAAAKRGHWCTKAPVGFAVSGNSCRAKSGGRPTHKATRPPCSDPRFAALSMACLQICSSKRRAAAASGPGLATGTSELCGTSMTGVAALPVMSLADIAAALPKTADGPSSAESIFDDLLAALTPMLSDQASGPPPSSPQAAPLLPASASEPAVPQASLPDAIESLEATFGEANTRSQILPAAPQPKPAKPEPSANPVSADPAGQAFPQNRTVAPVQPRSARSERAGAGAPANKDVPNDGLAALAMVLPQ